MKNRGPIPNLSFSLKYSSPIITETIWSCLCMCRCGVPSWIWSPGWTHPGHHLPVGSTKIELFISSIPALPGQTNGSVRDGHRWTDHSNQVTRHDWFHPSDIEWTFWKRCIVDGKTFSWICITNVIIFYQKFKKSLSVTTTFQKTSKEL